MSFTIAIIGRPNVGKSTLFNRLVGQKLALVDDEPGVTRDRREGEARLGDLEFTVIDTAGLDGGAKGPPPARACPETTAPCPIPPAAPTSRWCWSPTRARAGTVKSARWNPTRWGSA